MFNKINNSLFKRSLQSAGIERQVEAAQMLEVASEVINERFGGGAHIHARPTYIKERELTISIAHSAVGQEIRQQEEAIISEINKRIGRPEILRIQFILPRGPEAGY